MNTPASPLLDERLRRKAKAVDISVESIFCLLLVPEGWEQLASIWEGSLFSYWLSTNHKQCNKNCSQTIRLYNKFNDILCQVIWEVIHGYTGHLLSLQYFWATGWTDIITKRPKNETQQLFTKWDRYKTNRFVIFICLLGRHQKAVCTELSGKWLGELSNISWQDASLFYFSSLCVFSHSKHAEKAIELCSSQQST